MEASFIHKIETMDSMNPQNTPTTYIQNEMYNNNEEENWFLILPGEFTLVSL